MRARAPIIFMMVSFSLPLGAYQSFWSLSWSQGIISRSLAPTVSKDAGRPVCAEPGSGPCRQLYFQGASPWRRSHLGYRKGLPSWLFGGFFRDNPFTACIVTIFCRITDGFSHLGHAAFIHEIHNQLHLMERFKIGNFRLIASFA